MFFQKNIRNSTEKPRLKRRYQPDHCLGPPETSQLWTIRISSDPTGKDIKTVECNVSQQRSHTTVMIMIGFLNSRDNVIFFCNFIWLSKQKPTRLQTSSRDLTVPGHRSTPGTLITPLEVLHVNEPSKAKAWNGELTVWSGQIRQCWGLYPEVKATKLACCNCPLKMASQSNSARFLLFFWFKVLYAFKKLGDFGAKSCLKPGKEHLGVWEKNHLRCENWAAMAGEMKSSSCMFHWKYRESRCNGNDFAWMEQCIPQQFLAKHKSIKPCSSSTSLIISKKKRFLDLWKSTKGMKNPAVGKFNCPRNYVTPRLRALLVACATHCRSALAELLWRHHTWQTVQLKENVNVYDQLPSNYLLSFWN